MRIRAATRLAGLVPGFALLVAVQAAAQTAGDAAIPAGDVPDVLRARIGKPVTSVPRSGKELHDALIRLDDVSAIEMRNR